MALEIYRSGAQCSQSFDRHSEICRSCAEKEIKDGYYVEYDLCLSEKTDAITREDACQICEDTFFIDGRKKWEKLEGAVY
jgi:RNA polymerase subunit RPABC4/transcription elongation factor Spt4